MDFNLLLVAGVSVSTSTIIFFLWDFFIKKNQLISDKKETTCICTCKEFIDSTKSKSKSKFSKIKNFFSKPIHFPTFIKIPKFPAFRLILQPIFIRIRLAFKNMRITEQTKAEASLYKLAKLLWDQGKYSEAEQINSQMLNVRRIATGDLIRKN